jgi:hypothetical protein
MKPLSLFLALLFNTYFFAQNFSFNYNTSGRRVCLTTSKVDTINQKVNVLFLDSAANTTEPLFVYRRPYGTFTWSLVASNIPAGTGRWTDVNVSKGQRWEYQVKRQNTWVYSQTNYNATGYTLGALAYDNANTKGRMILLVASDVVNTHPSKYNLLKEEITGDGWYIQELIVPRATNWDSGVDVVNIKNQLLGIYNNAPANDKPKLLFILGHVPLPRAGSTSVTAPDEHDENKGARGCDAYYADIDGNYTDNASFNPGGLVTPLAINQPNDYKWDQDFFPSDVEMGFGRVDFADLTDLSTPELTMMGNYLDRLSNHKNVVSGFNMGNKSGFYFGYDNSNDGSYRSLPNISGAANVFQNYVGSNHNQFVQNNGPFQIYMQNLSVPSISDWQTFGMNATVYSSDQSYWGFGDVPQSGIYSRIRSLLGVPSKCLITFWTTTGINIFHQACSGEPLGLSMRTIMNHNTANQYLEKASQSYDEPDWWNRTHFAFYGDPSLNLYQIAPPSNPTVTVIGGLPTLQWTNSADPQVIGYHVFESTSKLGVYTRITSAPLAGSAFTLPNYQVNKWYMVKAVKYLESGCGQFFHSSIGKFAQGLVNVTNIAEQRLTEFKVYPNPVVDGRLAVTSNQPMRIIQLFSIDGRLLSEIKLNGIYETELMLRKYASGIYILKMTYESGAQNTLRISVP